jgi:hypothetical protein
VTAPLSGAPAPCSTWNSYSHPTPFHVKRMPVTLIHVKRIGRKDPR